MFLKCTCAKIAAVAQQVYLMLGSNNKTKDLKDQFSDLKTKLAVLEHKVEQVERQSESRAQWFRGIVGAVCAVLVIQVLKSAVDATNSAPKATPPSIANTTRGK
jgi:outer membrane murein-binding lipoprotein Lpp